jgi:arsenite/tail-anchored protein-transporting ATPase
MVSAAADQKLRLGNQRILFVGGKGGVGKTTTAAALGLRLAERGERCLIVSTDPAHSLGDLWDRQIGDRELMLAPNLWGLEIDPDAQVKNHLDAVKETMRDLVKPELYPEIERQMALARLSPGAVEAAMLERVSELMIGHQSKFDRVIFDTAPTGHTLRLLALPEIMGAWRDGLLRHRDRSDSWNTVLQKLAPRGSRDDAEAAATAQESSDARSNRIRALLLDRRQKFHQARHLLLQPGNTGFILVLIPEKLPILESRKAVEALNEHKVPILGMVVNRVLPPEPLGEFLERRREQEAAHLAEIDALFPQLHKIRVPLMSRDVDGLAALRSLADWLI